MSKIYAIPFLCEYNYDKIYYVLKEPEKRILNNLEYYREELRKSHSTGKRGDSGRIDDAELYKGITKDAPVGSETEAANKRNYLQDYEKLCRGEVRPQVSD